MSDIIFTPELRAKFKQLMEESEMENLDIRERVAKMLGWSNFGFGTNATGMPVFIGTDPDSGSQVMVPQYEVHDHHAIEVERYVAENGPIFAYWMYLVSQFTLENGKSIPLELVARLATPEQRCKAALEAMGEGEQ